MGSRHASRRRWREPQPSGAGRLAPASSAATPTRPAAPRHRGRCEDGSASSRRDGRRGFERGRRRVGGVDFRRDRVSSPRAPRPANVVGCACRIARRARRASRTVSS
jgi:hypothetical protein